MLKWLDDSDILTYLTHNQAKSVVTLRDKVYNKITANDSKSYLGYSRS